MDLLKELYIYEDGKQYLTSTGMQISESLFKEAMKFVTNKNLRDIDFKRDISRLREKSKWQLQNVLHINFGKVSKVDKLRTMSSTEVPKNDTMEECQNYVSSLEKLSDSVFAIRSEQSQTTEKLNQTLHYYDQAVSDIREQQQELLKKLKLILETKQISA